MTAKDPPRRSAPDLRSYGRSRGRKLSPRQQQLLSEDLPRFSLDLSGPAPPRPGGLFGRPADLWLEIGFGSGDHLIWQAEHHPAVDLIGCEPYVDGIVKVLSAICERQFANVRLYDGDARAVVRWLPPASLARV